MGSRGTRPAFGRHAGIALAVWAVSFSLLVAATAIACDLEAKLDVDNQTPYVGEMVYFDASGSKGYDSHGGGIVAYKFRFGDGTRTDWLSQPYVSHAYDEAGNFTASVTVKDRRGNTDNASIALSVRPLPPPPAPDLVPVFAAAEPSHPTAGDSVNVTVVLLNRGGTAVDAAKVDAFDRAPNGTVVSLGSVSVTPSIEPGGIRTIAFGPFVVKGVGNHTLRVVVSNVTPPPTGEGERTLNLTMTVSPATMPPPPAATYPDLTPLFAKVNPDHPYEGDSVTVTVFVLNRGDATATAATLLIFDVLPDGQAFLGSTLLPRAVGPSSVETVAFAPFQAAGVGNHTLRIVVSNVVPAELTARNNILDVSVRVFAIPPPPPEDNEGGPSLDVGAVILAGLAGAGIASAVATTVYFLRPRPRVRSEPPSHIPPDHSPRPVWPP